MIRRNRWYRRGIIILKATTVLLTASVLASMAQLSSCAATTWTFWGDEEEIAEDGSDTVCVATVYKGQTEQFLDLADVEGEITWSVDRPEILDIGPDGELIPLKVGNAMVTAIVNIDDIDDIDDIDETAVALEQTENASVFTGSSIFDQTQEDEIENEELEETENTEMVYQYYVSVCKKKAYKAVKKARNALGAVYSQSRRMKKGYYDCSSLVWRSYSPYGITFGNESWAPTAADQGLWCEENGKILASSAIELSVGKLLPGDLIFYTKDTNNGRYKNIYHVAMFEGYEMELDEETGETVLSATMIEASGTNVVRNPYRTGNGSSRIAFIGRPTK